MMIPDAGREHEEKMMDALQVMERANKIMEDFPLPKYALYIGIYAVETALAFWIALHI